MRILDLRQDEGNATIWGEIVRIEPSERGFTANICLDTGYVICLDAEEIKRIAKEEKRHELST